MVFMPFERLAGGSVGPVALFFGNVNQVLVRLWARTRLSVSVASYQKSLMTVRLRQTAERRLIGLSDREAVRSAPTVGGEGSEAW
jgi:hypothetical protein